MPPYGVSFLEGMGPDDQQRQQNGASPAGRAQEAIRVLQLRLPRGPMFGGIAPAPLLQGPGAMGSPIGGGGFQVPAPGVAPSTPNPMMDAIIGMAGMNPFMGGGPIPAPHVTPINPNEPGPNTNPFPNAPGGHTLPQPTDPVARPSPNPGATPLGQRRPEQDFPYFPGTTLPMGWGGMY